MKYLLIPITLIFLFGCTPEPLKLEVDQAPSKVVVGNQIVPDRGMVIALTRSFSALSDGTEGNFTEEDLSNYLVSGADVSIQFGNETVELQEIEPGLYFSIEVIQREGATYNLSIKDSTTDQEATATTLVLAPVVINNGSAKIDLRPTGEKWLNLNFDFNDPSGKNYYMFNVYINPRIPTDSSGREPKDIGGRKGGAPQNDFSGLGNVFSDYAETWLFTDEGFDGSTIEKDITIFDINVSEEDTLFFTLSNISEEYYLFLQGRERSRNTIPFVGEPTTLPTNIENGYGYFSMHYPVPYFLEIEEE